MNTQILFKWLSIFFDPLLKKSHLNSTKNLLGFSGGQDSTFLFIYLFIINLKKNKSYRVLHLNHLIQKDNFYYTSNNFKLSFLFDTNYHLSAPMERLTNEFKSCLWRYSMFFRVAYFYIYKSIWLAHSNTDYCEKFFLNLFRGGLNFGSSFLRLKKNLHFLLLRPLLNISRETLKKWIIFLEFPISIDSTNRVIFFSRNRIRFFLFPFLKYFFDQKIELKITKINFLTTEYLSYFEYVSKQLFFFLYSKQNLYFLMPNIIKKFFIKQFLKYSKKSFSNNEISFINDNLFKNSNVNFIKKLL
ncbi:tRNA-Ile lysidine synthase (chloroplast) [Bryopsis sp. KO-2023]|nr:tRNA-Ile lysidine synthase [Bryopsis sp. KO-2023]